MAATISTSSGDEDVAGDSRSAQKFRGPLFIVGRPRSGTKLLRTLLNEHPLVAIPISETNFIPEMVAHYGNPPPFDTSGAFNDFYGRFSQTIFFDWRKKHGIVLSAEQLCRLADTTSWSSIFENILKHYAPKPIAGDVIWGDKSPSYLTHIPLLKALFPSARFLHIIRDPRDQCLSAKRSWGRSLRSSAAVWERDVASAIRSGRELGSDYEEIVFEELLDEPEAELRRVCSFLQIDFAPTMLTPSVSHEPRGDTGGIRRIVSGNQKKYRSALKPRTQRRLEEIVYPTAAELGFELELARRHRPLGAAERACLLVYDGLALTGTYVKKRGLVWGLNYFGHKVRKLVAR